MKIQKTAFKGLKIIIGKIYYDSRGFFREIYKKKILKSHRPIFWCTSKSKKNVLRGLHLQTRNTQEKFVSVINGKILDVVVDVRSKSKTFGKHFKIILSDKNAKSLLIPAGFAHGFCGLEKENLVFYGCTNYRSKKNEIGILWKDKNLDIKWPLTNAIVSKKDQNCLELKSVIKKLRNK